MFYCMNRMSRGTGVNTGTPFRLLRREVTNRFSLKKHVFRNVSMRHRIGIAIQFSILVFLPLLIWWQLTFGFRLIVMPAMLLVSAILFWIATRLRES